MNGPTCYMTSPSNYCPRRQPTVANSPPRPAALGTQVAFTCAREGNGMHTGAAFESGTGQRLVKGSDRRIRAASCYGLLPLFAAQAEKIVSVQDNLDTSSRRRLLSTPTGCIGPRLGSPLSGALHTQKCLRTQLGRTCPCGHRPPVPAPVHSQPNPAHGPCRHLRNAILPALPSNGSLPSKGPAPNSTDTTRKVG